MDFGWKLWYDCWSGGDRGDEVAGSVLRKRHTVSARREAGFQLRKAKSGAAGNVRHTGEKAVGWR